MKELNDLGFVLNEENAYVKKISERKVEEVRITEKKIHFGISEKVGGGWDLIYYQGFKTVDDFVRFYKTK